MILLKKLAHLWKKKKIIIKYYNNFFFRFLNNFSIFFQIPIKKKNLLKINILNLNKDNSFKKFI